MRIEYVGAKARKEDNVAGTGTVWQGTGDVQDVADEKASMLLARPEIWRRAGDSPLAEQGLVDEAPVKRKPGRPPKAGA